MKKRGLFRREAEFMTLSWVGGIAIGIGAAFVLPHLMRDPCGNTIVEALPSPDGSHKAVVFVRNCGATTDFSTQMSVLRGDSGTRGHPHSGCVDRLG